MTYQPPPYQPPYQPPQAGYSNFDYYQPDVLGPSRRAAMMMYVVGALALLGSFCCVGIGAMVPQMMQNPELASEMSKIPNATPEVMRVALFISGGLSLLLGIVYIVVGVFIGRGSKGATITGLVLSILVALGLLLNVISSVAFGGGNMLGACVMVVPLGLVALLIVWLLGALKSAEQATAARYAMQYWQYQQQQQGYGGYPGQMPAGYPPPQPPHVPPPAAASDRPEPPARPPTE